ncbi:WecB/TagA/CpsF family glycosyltransferase, partial [Vibrio lentus]|uniref:WecB/TagA/CpsF family glycosyltransferase n=1 Tax=Vibrio lentus TaxID=136468 RepID=UPI0024690068
NGTDLIPNILNYSMKKKRKVVLIGSEESNVKSCCHKLMKQGVDVAVSVNGFLDESNYIDVLSELRGESLTIILGMGMPKQELFSIKVKDHFLNEDFIIVSGGAIIDRLSGKVNRGPRFLVNNNLEWLYRFYSEPKRLFNRIVIGGGRFLLFAIRFAIKSRALAQ